MAKLSGNRRFPILPSFSLLEQIPDMVFMMSIQNRNDFRYQFMNSSAMHASGLNDYAYGATFHDVVEPAEASFLYHKYANSLARHRPVSFMLDHEGQIGESIISAICDPSGKATHIMGIVRDVTERVHREQQLKYLAFRDQLTGLFNRHAVTARIDDAVKKANDQGQILAILMLDCDNLKSTNDTCGHFVGDVMLREVADRLRSSVTSAHTIARIGGDEFLLAAMINAEMEVFEIAENILRLMRQPWVHEDKSLHIATSIGISMYPIHSRDLQEVMKTADRSLYLAKALGGNQYMLDRVIKS